MIAGILAVTVAAAYASLLYRGVAAVHVGFGFKLILCASALLPYGELREVAAESVLIAEGKRLRVCILLCAAVYRCAVMIGWANRFGYDGLPKER